MSSNKILLLSLLIVSTGKSWAACNSIKWEVEGHSEAICYDAKTDLMISAVCEEKPCKARTLAEKARTLDLRSSEERPRNPGSHVCKFLNGKIVIGENSRGSTNAFCKASDGTLVNLSGLAQ